MKLSTLYLPMFLLFLVSCSRSFEPVDYGKEACAHCKMTIVDSRFAAEIVDEKGKVFKFDDVICLKQFQEEHQKNGDNLIFVGDYLKKQEGMLDASQAVFLKHESFRTPMNGQTAAFATIQDAQSFIDSLQTKPLTWSTLK